MSAPFALIAGHIVNLQTCNYVKLRGSTVHVSYNDDTLELELSSATEAAQAMVMIANELKRHGLLVDTAQPK
jgi:hypothetical protein